MFTVIYKLLAIVSTCNSLHYIIYIKIFQARENVPQKCDLSRLILIFIRTD